MANKTSIFLNIIQNSSDFQLNDAKDSPIFKRGLFSKTLDPIKENPENIENYRSVTIKCLQPNCK
ncbi:hypothetical protein DL98DRAFT_522580 [Cadophora sp. DSE1049]|nr:hypothetical protein DL98DRAFT_522580 [Cadophora sp. DSE1049]